MEQRTLYKVFETYTLDTRLGDGHSRELVIHSNALPKLLEWPPCPYYTLKGIPLKDPELWNGIIDMNESDDEGFDFSTRSTTIPFMTQKRFRR
jgi:hypothetical protein